MRIESQHHNIHTKIMLTKATVWAWWEGLPSEYRLQAHNVGNRLLQQCNKTTTNVITAAPEDVQAIEGIVNPTKPINSTPCSHPTHRRYLKKDIVELLQKHQMIQSATKDANQTDCNTRTPNLNETPPRIWGKTALLHPKIVKASNAGIIMNNGERASNPEEFQETLRENRDAIWTKTHHVNLKEADAWLQDYAKKIKPTLAFPPPTIEQIESTILLTPDTAPGLDGIPYAFWRLFYQITARLILNFILQIQTTPEEAWANLAPTVQMLVWIPKIEGADTAEQMRPLALPDTFIRILAKLLSHIFSLHMVPHMNQSQALVSDTPEAQWNFERAQHFLNTGQILTRKGMRHTSNTQRGRSLVLADLRQAFERVNPQWVLMLLATWEIPTWLFNISAYLITGRRTRYKVGKWMGAIIHMMSGVDMGNGTAPFFFCLALDPLLHKLDTIPGVALSNAYMDDLSVGTITHIARHITQNLITKYGKVSGLIIQSHTCYKIQIFLQKQNRNKTWHTIYGPSLGAICQAAHHLTRKKRS